MLRRILIFTYLYCLGEPGSGKTTELLGLADDLLRAAIEDEVLPIPVIFELAAWNGKPLGEWLVEQLYEVETVPKVVGKRWVEGAQVLLLLDGLDELEQQQDCIDAIDKFLKSSPATGTVVCFKRGKGYLKVDARGTSQQCPEILRVQL